MMIRPEDVTDAMVEAHETARRLPRNDKREVIAAALTAMPDDLLRKLVAERGCVMVPVEKFKRWMYLAAESRSMLIDHEMQEFFYPDANEVVFPVAQCDAADPREQALDRMAENAQELGLYDDKEQS